MVPAQQISPAEAGIDRLIRSGRHAGPVGRQAVDHRFPFRYPWEVEEWTSLRSGRRVFLRPIRPGDENAYHQLFTRLEPQDIRFRFFGLLKKLPKTEINRFQDINYDREINIIANAVDRGGCPEMLGVVGGFLDVEISSVEFAMVVRSDLKRQGLGTILLSKMIGYCFAQGFRRITGEVLKTNAPMLGLTDSLGFKFVYKPKESEVFIWLRLR